MALGFTIVNCLFGANIILVGNILLVFGTWGGGGGGGDQISIVNLGQKGRRRFKKGKTSPARRPQGSIPKNWGKWGTKATKSPIRKVQTRIVLFLTIHPRIFSKVYRRLCLAERVSAPSKLGEITSKLKNHHLHIKCLLPTSQAAFIMEWLIRIVSYT